MLQTPLVLYQSNDKAAISFPRNAETSEAAAPYDNLYLQTKLDHGLDLVGVDCLVQ